MNNHAVTNPPLENFPDGDSYPPSTIRGFENVYRSSAMLIFTAIATERLLPEPAIKNALLSAELFPLDARAELTGLSNCFGNLSIFLVVKTFPSLSQSDVLGLSGEN